jgi:hypothetical protein
MRKWEFGMRKEDKELEVESSKLKADERRLGAPSN